MSKRNTFYGAAAILTVSTILVKIIGAIFKIPLIAILPEEAYGDFNGAYNLSLIHISAACWCSGSATW